jgi:cytochrome oxidase Cu insertion factor (SCO1/SenC/PrrC family)
MKPNWKAKMKISIAILFLTGVFGLAAHQENLSTNALSVPSIGLPIGQPAPTFALPDQFGQQQSNETLKGLNGTVLLFFRSADW